MQERMEMRGEKKKCLGGEIDQSLIIGVTILSLNLEDTKMNFQFCAQC